MNHVADTNRDVIHRGIGVAIAIAALIAATLLAALG